MKKLITVAIVLALLLPCSTALTAEGDTGGVLGMTRALATHDLHVAQQAQRVISLADGCVVCDRGDRP